MSFYKIDFVGKLMAFAIIKEANMKSINSKLLLSLLVVAWCASSISATEKTKGQEEKTTPTSQPTTQTPDKVEPLGLEGGDFVNKPADLADKIGNKIEEVTDNLFGKKKKDHK